MKLYFYNSDIQNILGACNNIFDILKFLENTPSNPICDIVDVQVSKSGSIFQLTSNLDNRGWIYRTKDNKLICANTETKTSVLNKKHLLTNMPNECYPVSVQPLVDGTLLRLYFNDGKWRLATNKCMDAHQSFYNDVESFGEKFGKVLNSLGFTGLDYKKMNRNFTYMVILTEDNIYYVGCIHVLFGGGIQFFPCRAKVGLPVIRENGRRGFTKRLPTFIAKRPRDLTRRLSNIASHHLGVSLLFNNHPYIQVFCKTEESLLSEYQTMKTNCSNQMEFVENVKNNNFDMLAPMSLYLSMMLEKYYVKREKIPPGLYKTKIIPRMNQFIMEHYPDEEQKYTPQVAMEVLRYISTENFKSCMFVYKIYKMTNRYYEKDEKDEKESDEESDDSGYDSVS